MNGPVNGTRWTDEWTSKWTDGPNGGRPWLAVSGDPEVDERMNEGILAMRVPGKEGLENARDVFTEVTRMAPDFAEGEAASASILARRSILHRSTRWSIAPFIGPLVGPSPHSSVHSFDFYSPDDATTQEALPPRYTRGSLYITPSVGRTSVGERRATRCRVEACN